MHTYHRIRDPNFKIAKYIGEGLWIGSDFEHEIYALVTIDKAPINGAFFIPIFWPASWLPQNPIDHDGFSSSHNVSNFQDFMQTDLLQLGNGSNPSSANRVIPS